MVKKKHFTKILLKLKYKIYKRIQNVTKKVYYFDVLNTWN